MYQKHRKGARECRTGRGHHGNSLRLRTRDRILRKKYRKTDDDNRNTLVAMPRKAYWLCSSPDGKFMPNSPAATPPQPTANVLVGENAGYEECEDTPKDWADANEW